MIPKIRVAFNGWESSITLNRVIQSINDSNGEVINKIIPICFFGVVQPLGLKELMTKPTEQRSWQWLQIHTRTQQPLSTNDIVEYCGKQYQIRAENSYQNFGYYEYHLVKNYT